MRFRPRAIEGNVNVTPTHPLLDMAVLLAGTGAALLVLYFALGFVVDLMVPRISPSFERRIAATFHGKFGAQDTSGAAQYCQRLVDTLSRCAQLPYPCQVVIAPSSTANALALPGGRIVVFRGLFGKLKSRNELAFVLAHEIGHFINRDHLRGLGRGLVLLALTSAIAGPNSDAGGVVAGWLNLGNMKFSRAREEAADAIALDAVECTYGHVGGATAFFRSSPGERRRSYAQHLFSTHPEMAMRTETLNRRTADSGYVVDTPLGLPEFLIDPPDSMAEDTALQR